MKCDDTVEFEIVLQVLNVVGFEFQNDNILLQCTLDGVVLQTETIFAKTDKVQANASVTWSSTKGEIKRMKAENLPIKVVCFRIAPSSAKHKLEPIGFVLIPLRIIPTFLYKNDLLSTPRWFQMMGVSNSLAHNKPELHLNVIIQPEAECLSATHLRGKIDDDDDGDPLDSFAEPDLSNHFELQMEEEMTEEVNEAPVLQKDECKLNAEIESFVAEPDNRGMKVDEEDDLKRKQMDLISDLLRLREEQKSKEENKLREEEKFKDEMRWNVEQELKALKEENVALKDRVRELEKAAMELLNTGVQQNQKIKQLEASMAKLKESKDYYKQKWVELIREVNKLGHDC